MVKLKHLDMRLGGGVLFSTVPQFRGMILYQLLLLLQLVDNNSEATDAEDDSAVEDEEMTDQDDSTVNETDTDFSEVSISKT